MEFVLYESISEQSYTLLNCRDDTTDLIEPDATVLLCITADTWEEAKQIATEKTQQYIPAQERAKFDADDEYLFDQLENDNDNDS